MNKLATLTLGVLALASFAAAQSVKVELLASMTGNGKGKAKYKSVTRGALFEAQLEFEGENLRPNTAYVVAVSNGFTAPVKTDGFGRYALARRFTAPTLPFRAGMTVTLTRVGGPGSLTGAFALR